MFYTPPGETAGNWYDVNWQRTDDSDAQFFRPNEGLGQNLIEQAKKDLRGFENLVGPNVVPELVFEYNPQTMGQYSDLKNLIDKSGTVIVEKLTIKTAKQTLEHLLLAACTTTGDIVHPDTIDRLLELPVIKTS